MMGRRAKARDAIATALLHGRAERHWGYELSRQAGVRAAVMYPMLQELLDGGHLEDGWESPEEAQGRPPRRYYTVTADGADFLPTWLHAYRIDTSDMPVRLSKRAAETFEDELDAHIAESMNDPHYAAAIVLGDGDDSDDPCPRRHCRGRVPHSRLLHWFGWVR